MQILDPLALVSCFPSSVLVARVEAARRKALMRADEAFMLRTQTDLMPRVREYLASLKETMEANEKVQANFEELFKAAKTAFDAHIKYKSTRKTADHREWKAKKVVVSELVTEKHALRSEADKCFRKSHTLFGAIIHYSPHQPAGARGAAAAAADAATGPSDPEVLKAPPRYVKCCADAEKPCAGMFAVDADAKAKKAAPCMVCEAVHCPWCLVHVGADADPKAHTCVPEDLASARYLMSETKSCPRCLMSIQRISGCPQMMCTGCFEFFDWNTGKAVEGPVHNPHFFALSEEMRRVALAGRGGNGGHAQGAFDALCTDFNSDQFFTELQRMYGLSVRNAYQNVRHVRYSELTQCRTAHRVAADQERSFRLRRIARLLGPDVVFGNIMDFKTCSLYNRNYASSVFVVRPSPCMSDAEYAQALLTNDGKRRREAEKIEIYQTYLETAETIFRTALMRGRADFASDVEYNEHLQMNVKRIVEYRKEVEQLIKNTTKAAKLAALRNARDAAVGKRKRGSETDEKTEGKGKAKSKAKGKGTAKAKDEGEPAFKRPKRPGRVSDTESEFEESDSDSEDEVEDAESEDESEDESDSDS